MKLKKRPVTTKQESSFKDIVFFWKGVPVCLTKQLAEFYETSSDTLMKNFHRHVDRFKVRSHYVKLQRQQILLFLEAAGIEDWGKNVTVLYLWTGLGCFLHATIFRSEIVHENVFRLLDFEKFVYFIYEQVPQDFCRKNIKNRNGLRRNVRVLVDQQLYVVLFNNGVVKVGKGKNAMKRINAHAKDANIFDLHVANFFIEENPLITEEDLIEFCKQHGTLYNGNEYFKDLDYNVVVNFVKRTVERKVLRLVC